MGIQIKGSNDTISASDGSMVLEGAALTFDNENITGISTMATAVVTSGDLTVGVSTLFADNSTGKTGLGTDVPSSRLQVCGKSTLHGYSEASVEWGDTSNLGALSFTSTTGNPIVRANSGKDLVFQTNGGNTRLTILSDGQVTVGSATEGHADADELTLAGTRTGMTIRSANDDYGNIFFSDATSGTAEYVGAVQYYHGDNTLRLKTNSTDRLIINKEGDVNITGVCTATSFSGIVGGLTPISKTTVSSNVSAVSFTEALTGAFDTYKTYVVIMDGVLCASDNEDMHLRVRHGSNGGTLYSNSDYLSMTNGPSADDSFSAADKFRLNYNNVGNLTVGSYVKEDWNMVLYMHGFENNRRFRYHGTTTYMSSDGNLRGQFINGAVTDATEVTGIEFFFTNSNNITAGTISLFGVNG